MSSSSPPTPKVLPPEAIESLTFSDRLTSLLNRLQISSESLTLVAAFLVGGTTGLAIALFRYLTRSIEDLTFESLMGVISPLGTWTLAIVPAVGGLLVGLLRWWLPEFFGQGWSSLLSDSRDRAISPLRPVLKLLGAALSLGTGASLGPEGPSVEIGANIGVLLGQGFQVAKERYRLLLGAGAAAGLAAGFNAPIAGVFFALEVVLGQAFTTQGASLILLSAVVSSLIARAVFGVQAEFDLPTYQVLSNWEWLCYLGLGILASGVSLAYTQAIRLCQQLFQGELPTAAWVGRIPPLLKPAVGGLIVGLIALGLPQILGVGYSTLEVILKGGAFPLSVLLIMLPVKLLATALSLGSGLVGGIFAPAMFLGACLGAIYGQVLNTFLPTAIADAIASPAAYAMVGMAAVLGSSARAPLTAILLLFELTRNYVIILPLMAAVGVSVWIVERMNAMPAVQALALPQMGVNVRQTDDRDWLQHMTVAEVMGTGYEALEEHMTVVDAGWSMIKAKCSTILVLDKAQHLTGIVTLADIRRHVSPASSLADRHLVPPKTLKDICTKEILYAYPNELVKQVTERMVARGLQLLPVVNAAHPRQVLGVLEQHQVNLAADFASTQAALNTCIQAKMAEELTVLSKNVLSL
jgi:H+/Cl- antiporter ClcA/CBS domain-containing protein